MTRSTPLIVALLGSLLLWAAWPVSSITFLIFIAWVPLLWVEDRAGSARKFMAITYLHMLAWNVLTTWWVWNASPAGALGAFFANSLIMCIPWLLFFYTKRKLGSWIGYGSLIIFWLSFEYLHHNWELSWPWLTLGNAFATKTDWIQWYQVTGTSGGTLWILLTNIIAYHVFKSYRNQARSAGYARTLAVFILVLASPIIISRLILAKEQKIAIADLAGAKSNVVVVQPNVDSYTEKFSIPVEEQVRKLIVLSEQQIDPRTSLVIWPETAVPAQAWEDQIKTHNNYQAIFSFLNRHQQVNLLTGIDSYKKYSSKKEASLSSRTFADGPQTIYYDAYNTAAFIDSDTNIQLYHKAKLVPGVETLPSFLGFMGSLFEDFGGISGTLGRDSERKVFRPWDNYYRSAPVICYESIYGDYVTEYMRKGANLLTIITNDGWWGNTPGHRQHMNYARLRAIETRKWVARSANTGISCFIDPLGNIINPQPWDTEAAIKLSIPTSPRQTFYVRNGDLLSRASVGVSAIILALLFFRQILSWLKRKKAS